MKFKVYDKSCQYSSSNKNNQQPLISVHEKGEVYLNKYAQELINHDYIKVVQDEANPKDWYLTADDEGLFFKPKYNGAKSNGSLAGYVVNSKVLTADMKKALGLVKVRNKMLIASTPINIDGQDYYAILTSSIH